MHVPFCLSKCAYCDFYSCQMSAEGVAVYLQGLKRELKVKGELWGGLVDTVYLGGGTPSILDTEVMAAVLAECGRFFPWSFSAEVTLEANPGTVSKCSLARMYALGINRLSIGLQAAQAHHLTRLGRIHGLTAFYEAMRNAQEVGFTNISVDAMYGLPRQTTAEYIETLACICNSGATHVSAYALQVEPHTPFYIQWEQGELVVPADEEVAEMMLAGREYLLSRGFEQYEISNFAKPGSASCHNLTYWRNQPYIGLGPSAASYVNGRRFVNVSDLTSYSNLLQGHRLPVASCEHLGRHTEMAETAILGLRLLNEGIDLRLFYERFGVNAIEHFEEPISHWEQQGYLLVDELSIRLTLKALPVASQVQMSFLP